MGVSQFSGVGYLKSLIYSITSRVMFVKLHIEATVRAQHTRCHFLSSYLHFLNFIHTSHTLPPTHKHTHTFTHSHTHICFPNITTCSPVYSFCLAKGYKHQGGGLLVCGRLVFTVVTHTHTHSTRSADLPAAAMVCFMLSDEKDVLCFRRDANQRRLLHMEINTQSHTRQGITSEN